MNFRLLIILVVLVRIIAFVYFVMIEGQYMTFDSPPYLNLAENIIDNQVFSTAKQPPFSAHVWRTPGYPLFLAFISLLGMKSLYWVVFWQELVYGIFAYIFYRYGKPIFGEKIAKIALVFLLIEPSGLAFPKLIMTETLFMPFLLGGILAIGYYLHQFLWRYIFIAGVLMGIGALVRPAILYLPIVVAGVLLAFDFFNRKRWLHVGIFFGAFILALSPWLIRNYSHYQQIYVSGQSSYGLAYFHVPLVLEAEKVMPFEAGWEYVAERVRHKSEQLTQSQGTIATPLQVHEIEKQVALEELVKYPSTYANRWLIGMLKAMSSPLIIELYDVYKIHQDERLHLLEEISNAGGIVPGIGHYLLHQDKLYLFDFIFSLFLAAFALLGALNITFRRDCFLWIMMLTTFYFISIPGPSGHGRFRVPVELFWFIQACIGFIWVNEILGKWRNRKNRVEG
jgi:4-amino-4-deoxy-L-arabinose transferase-like glycosyltransferase